MVRLGSDASTQQLYQKMRSHYLRVGGRVTSLQGCGEEQSVAGVRITSLCVKVGGRVVVYTRASFMSVAFWDKDVLYACFF